MHFEEHIDIAAPPQRVWAVMSDVERWPEWTPSVSRLELLSPGPLAIGSKARIRQPKFPPAIWRVTALEPGVSFSWVSTAPGLVVSGQHAVAARDGGTQATLSLHFGGPLGGLWARVTRGITEQYLGFEAAGLKRRSEIV